MPGLWDNIVNFFTGDEERAAKEASDREQQRQAKIAAEQLAKAEEDRQRSIADQKKLSDEATADVERGRSLAQGAASSMGKDSAEYMQKADAAAQGQATKSAEIGSTLGARQALAAARSAGLNKGQASLRAGQAAGDAYSGQYMQGLDSGRQQYMGATAQMAQTGAQQQQMGQQGRSQAAGFGIQGQGIGAQTGLGASQGAGQMAQTQQGIAGQNAAAGGGFVGGVLNWAGDALSDETKKENVVERDALRDLIDKVKPVEYNYTEESGEDPNKHRVGILAQDLEKTNMADNVIDTPEGKKVDIPQQTLSNTNLIVQLAQELYDLKDELRRVKGE